MIVRSYRLFLISMLFSWSACYYNAAYPALPDKFINVPPPPISQRTLIPWRHISIKPLESHNFQITLSSRNGTRRIKENWVCYWIHATLSEEEMGVMCSGNFCLYCTNKAVGIAVKPNCLQCIRIKWIFYLNSYLVRLYKWEVDFRRKLCNWSKSFAIIGCTQLNPKNPSDRNFKEAPAFRLEADLLVMLTVAKCRY